MIYEKHALGLDPGVGTGLRFGPSGRIRSCSSVDLLQLHALPAMALADDLIGFQSRHVEQIGERLKAVAAGELGEFLDRRSDEFRSLKPVTLARRLGAGRRRLSSSRPRFHRHDVRPHFS